MVSGRNKEASLGEETYTHTQNHQKTQTKEFQKVQAYPKEAQV